MKNRHFHMAAFASVLVCLILGACTFSKPKEPRLEGKRVAVMLQGSSLVAKSTFANAPISVAPPIANVAWALSGGTATHAPYHLALGSDLRRAFKVNAGHGSSDERRLLAQPVVDADGRIFVLDADARLYVFAANTGTRLWARDLRPKEERGGTLGAGLAAVGGRVFVSTGFAQILALDAGNGRVLWRKKLSAPFRSAPSVVDGRLFAVSTDNRTHALEAETGTVLWTHRGSVEQASLLGGASPAYENGKLVVAYSSGELFGLNTKNGREIWSEFLSQRRHTSGIGTIADIRASPVIDRGRVFAVSNSGYMVALTLTDGRRIWQKRIGATSTPWIGGDYLYLVTTENLLVCLRRHDGQVVWGRSLDRYQDKKKRRDWISWSGPVLAGDRLILAGTNKKVLAVSPYTGDLLGQIKVSEGVEISPIIARGTLYLLTRDAELIAWR
jgi:outer membrane protein assembly factor BamB